MTVGAGGSAPGFWIPACAGMAVGGWLAVGKRRPPIIRSPCDNLRVNG